MLRCEFLEASAVLIMRKIVSLYHDFYCNSHIATQGVLEGQRNRVG